MARPKLGNEEPANRHSVLEEDLQPRAEDDQGDADDGDEPKKKAVKKKPQPHPAPPPSTSHPT